MQLASKQTAHSVFLQSISPPPSAHPQWLSPPPMRPTAFLPPLPTLTPAPMPAVPSYLLPTACAANRNPTGATPPPPARRAQSATPAARVVCRVCKNTYDPAENGPTACRYHPEQFSGRLLRVEPTDTSDLQFFFDCCGATDRDAPGCTLGAHEPYS